MAEEVKTYSIKKDATFEIGTKFVEDLQTVLIYLSKGIDPEDLQKRVQEKGKFSEQETEAIRLTGLLVSLYNSAKERDMLVQSSITSDMLSSSV